MLAIKVDAAVQNGASPARVIVFALDSSRMEIAGETVVERATPTLGEPTHGVLVETTFYYIANSGWDGIDEHGAARPAKRLEAAVIMRVDGIAARASSRRP